MSPQTEPVKLERNDLIRLGLMAWNDTSKLLTFNREIDGDVHTAFGVNNIGSEWLPLDASASLRALARAELIREVDSVKQRGRGERPFGDYGDMVPVYAIRPRRLAAQLTEELRDLKLRHAEPELYLKATLNVLRRRDNPSLDLSAFDTEGKS